MQYYGHKEGFQMNKVRFKLEALSIGLFGLAIVAAVALTGCGRHHHIPGPKGEKGDVGETGSQGYGAGILSESISGLCGATDGVKFTTYQDKNNNAALDLDESVLSVSTVCNGQSGQNGLNGSDGASSVMTFTASAPSCSNGGYTVSVQNGAVTTSFPVCNGLDGVDGAQGIQGLQGPAGADGGGSTVTPVKFCNNDSSAYPEYGLYIDGMLFAVYWGDTPGSNGHQEQAFLTKVTPGTYQSTGGNNCTFTIN
jgi:hypothetical protein